MLECVRLVAAERPGRKVIVDLPATGHGVAWLRVPKTLREVANSGPFFELSDRVAREVVAEGKCSPVVVTLPERMVVRETAELCGAMEREVGVRVSRLVVNRVPASVPATALTDAIHLAEGGRSIAGAAKELATVLERREQARLEALAALAEAEAATHLSPVLLPDFPTDPESADVAAWLNAEGAW